MDGETNEKANGCRKTRVQYSIISTVLGVHSVTRIYMRRLELGLWELTFRREFDLFKLRYLHDTVPHWPGSSLTGIILYQAI